MIYIFENNVSVNGFCFWSSLNSHKKELPGKQEFSGERSLFIQQGEHYFITRDAYYNYTIYYIPLSPQRLLA